MTNTLELSNSRRTGMDIIRLGGIAAVVAGAAWAVSGVVHFTLVYPQAGTGPTGSVSDYLIEGAHAVAEAGMLGALLGLRARQVSAYGWLGAAGFALAFLGTARLWAITVMVELSPAGTWTGTWGMAMEDTGATLMSPPGVIFPCGEAPGDASSGFFSWTHIQSFPPIWAEQTTDTLAPDLPNARFTLSNNGGSDVTIDYAMLEIHCLQQLDYETQAGTIQSQA